MSPTISNVRAERSEPDVPFWMRLASGGYFLLFLAFYGSVFAGFVFASRLAVLVALLAFVTTLTVHLVASIIVYRQVMARLWPTVEPLADDDDWDAT
jgi:hypothetical protein